MKPKPDSFAWYLFEVFKTDKFHELIGLPDEQLRSLCERIENEYYNYTHPIKAIYQKQEPYIPQASRPEAYS